MRKRLLHSNFSILVDKSTEKETVEPPDNDLDAAVDVKIAQYLDSCMEMLVENHDVENLVPLSIEENNTETEIGKVPEVFVSTKRE